MMPGVTHLPRASMTNASAGAATLAPTAATFPSRRHTAPFSMAGPVAVKIVALRMRVGRDGTGAYVEGNATGSAAAGAERAVAAAGVAAGDWVAGAAASFGGGGVAGDAWACRAVGRADAH